MIELSEEMQKAVRDQRGSLIRLVDPVTQELYVLLRFEDFSRLVEYDDGPWTDEERDLLRAEAVEELGWEGMEVYQNSKDSWREGHNMVSDH